MRRLKHTTKPAKLQTELEQLRARQLTFNEFARRTNGDWDRLASYLRKRWQLPTAVEDEDVRQEMLLAAWKAVDKWDSTRGVSLKSYVVWTAVTKATKWIHRQRSAINGDCHAPGRFDQSFSSLGLDPMVDRSTMGAIGIDPVQVEMTAGRELFSKMLPGIDAAGFEAIVRNSAAMSQMICAAAE